MGVREVGVPVIVLTGAGWAPEVKFDILVNWGLFNISF